MIILNPRSRMALFAGLWLVSGCMNPEFSDQDVIVEYHLNKIKSLSMIDIPEDYKLKYYNQSEEGTYYKIQFDLSFPATDIRQMSEQFRLIRSQSTAPGWNKSPNGWVYFHQPLLDEQFKLRIDTVANRVEYSYFMAY